MDDFCAFEAEKTASKTSRGFNQPIMSTRSAGLVASKSN